MILKTRRQDSATHAANTYGTTGSTSSAISHGPVGAPRASEVKDVLLTLRSRLELQLEDADDYDPATVRALRGNVRCQLEQINEALARIDEGQYGVCADCLRPIEADRLVVRPYSTLCMGCQGRHDRDKGARS